MEKRIIKFRAWDGSKMITADKSNDGAGSGVFVLLMDFEGKLSWNNPYGFHSEKPATDLIVTQFTGLLDKSGREIYEGDIVRTEWGNNNPTDVLIELEPVIFKDGGFYVGDYWLYETNESAEIIGNIYENPELINS